MDAVLADSPSFTRQEIDIEKPWDILNTGAGSIRIPDGRSLYFEGSTNPAYCMLQNFTIPDLSSVSFISDGERLNTTFWLNGQFKAPPYDKYGDSPFINDTEIHQQHFWISTFNAKGKNLSQLADDDISDHRKNNFTLKGSNETRLANTIAQNLEFTGLSNRTDPIFGTHNITVLEILMVKENEAYRLTYAAEPIDYPDGLYTIQKMVDSFRIDQTIAKDSALEKGFYMYSNSQNEFTILYPSNWGKIESTDSKEPNVRFFSPINGPYMTDKTYLITFLVPSVYGSQTGYVNRLKWSIANGTWIERFEERSSDFKLRPLSVKSGNQTSYQIGDNFVQLPVDLRLMGLPNQYDIIFVTTERFIKNGRLCDWSDPSNVVSLPPPKFSITAETNSLVIGPGEIKNILINVHSHTNIPSNITLSTSQDENALFHTTITPHEIVVPPNGSSSATMSIDGGWDSAWNPAPIPHFLRIHAEITLPQFVSYGDIPVRTPNEPINEQTELVITELNLGSYSFDIWNHLNPVLSSLLTIVTTIIGFIGGWKSVDHFRKKSRKNDEDKMKFDEG
jgi:hypothetical protein